MLTRRVGFIALGLAAAASVAYGCGLTFDVAPSADGGGTDAPTTTATTPPPPRPDSAVDAEVDATVDAGPDAYPIDDDASFFPSNLDAAADVYTFESDADLKAPLTLIVKKPTVPGGPALVELPAATPKIDPAWVRYDEPCGCVALSLRSWNVPAGQTVRIEAEVPLVVVARDVRIDGNVIVVLGNGYAGPTLSIGLNGEEVNGGGTGGSGGGALTAGGSGGARNATTPGPLGGEAQDAAIALASGAIGGSGSGTGAGCGNGGNGGGALEIHSRIVNVTGTLSASGLGGERGCSNRSGTGGGAAGTLWIEGRYVDLGRAKVFAVGGGGGGGNNGSPGVPGTDGGAGGAGGSGAGAGGRGGDGTVLPADGGTGGASGGAARAGGGGGAAGHLRIRRLDGPDGGTFVPTPIVVP